MVENDRDNLSIVLLDVSLQASEKRVIHDGLAPGAEALDRFAARHADGLSAMRQVADVTIDTDGYTINELVEMIHAEWNALR